MEKSNKRLVEEVAKLISNTIVKEGAIYLPEIGSLCVSEGDNRSVRLSPEVVGSNIVVILAEKAKCSSKQAQSIYKKWSQEVVKSDKSIKIPTVGTISEGVFTPSNKILEKLNRTKQVKSQSKTEQTKQPEVKVETKESVEIKTKQGVKFWVIGLAAIIIAILTIFSNIYQREEAEVVEVVEVIEVEEAVEIEEVIEVIEVIEAEEVVVIEEVVEEPVIEAVVEEEPVEEEIGRYNITSKARFVKYPEASAKLAQCLKETTDSKRFRVVCGTLKARSNAGRLIIDAQMRGGQNVECRAYEYYDNYMITIFESNKISEAYNYINRIGNDLYDTMWVYDAK